MNPFASFGVGSLLKVNRRDHSFCAGRFDCLRKFMLQVLIADKPISSVLGLFFFFFFEAGGVCVLEGEWGKDELAQINEVIN